MEKSRVVDRLSDKHFVMLPDTGIHEEYITESLSWLVCKALGRYMCAVHYTRVLSAGIQRTVVEVVEVVEEAGVMMYVYRV